MYIYTHIRERQIKRQIQTDTYAHIDTHTERHTYTDTHTERDRQSQE